MSVDQQHPIASAFGHDSTARDVLSGVDLSGRTAVVTGGYSGLGLETVRALADAGTRVVVPARRPDVARRELAGLDHVAVGSLDLADQRSVAACADQLLSSLGSIDILIGAAGVMAVPETRVGPGWELQFATNQLGHFALVNRIYPLLKASEGARVISYSSTGHHFSDIHWDDLELREGYDKWVAYGQSKTATSLFAVELDRLGEDDGVRAFAVHPGGILTPLQRHLSREEQIGFGWFDEDGNANPIFKTPEQGASTGVWAATSPALDGVGGVYCEDCNVAAIVGPDDRGIRGVMPYAVDPDAARRLWSISAELTGVDAFGSDAV